MLSVLVLLPLLCCLASAVQVKYNDDNPLAVIDTFMVAGIASKLLSDSPVPFRRHGLQLRRGVGPRLAVHRSAVQFVVRCDVGFVQLSTARSQAVHRRP